MEQGAILQHSIPLHTDYRLQSDGDCLDQFAGHAHHSAYANGTAVDQLRRDGTMVQQSPSAFNFPATHGSQQARFVPDRVVAADSNSYQGANNFGDSTSGSFSTSPSSGASSLAYTNYPANHYTGLPTYTGPVQPNQAFASSTYAGSRVPPILETSGQSMLPPPMRTSIPSSTNAQDRDYAADSSPYLPRSQLSPSSHTGYSSYPETPRSAVLPVSLSPSGVGYHNHMASSNGQNYGTSTSECANFPWPNLEVLHDLSCNGQTVTPEIRAKVEKGFFPAPASKEWTCYRRNYFAVQCNFELHPSIANAPLFLKRNNNNDQVQAMGMRLSAAIEGGGGKNIELVQHTPKRDNGPKSAIGVTKVAPSPSGRADHNVSPHGVYQMQMGSYHATGVAPGPYLPLQKTGDGGVAASAQAAPSMALPYTSPMTQHLGMHGQNASHTFERVQFKSATANNGKRRASQQYFVLIVELFADVRKEGSGTANWVKVAQRVSEKIVVRGRSPSHYSNEGQPANASGRGGSASGGSSYGGGPGGSYGGMNAGGFRSSVPGYGSNIPNTTYRPGHYASYYPTPEHHQHPESASSSSSSSLNDPHAANGPAGPIPIDHHPVDTLMTDADRASIQDYDGYQYYPSSIYQELPPQPQTLPPLSKVESNAQYSTEPRQYAVKTAYSDAVAGPAWTLSQCRPYQGVESSRGYFPDLQAGFTS
ncbi:hypothetical protein MBLNU230_g0723t1 [Neophaeotheca triangularis]